MQDIEALCPDSKFLDEFAVDEDETINSQRDVHEWLQGLGFNEQSNY